MNIEFSHKILRYTDSFLLRYKDYLIFYKEVQLVKIRTQIVILTVVCLILSGLIIVFGLTGCSDGGGEGGIPDPSGNNMGTISGTVKDASGTPLQGVSININSNQAGSSNSNGSFSINNLTPATKVSVIFSNAGYVSTTKVVDVFSGKDTFIDVMMLKVDTVTTVNPSVNSTVDSGKASVYIPANSIVDVNGNIVTSDVTVKMAAAAPEDNNYLELFPGKFTGVISGGEEVPLKSYGFVNINFEDNSGNPLNVASGMNLTITMEASENDPPDIPLWYLDQNAGLWIEEGQASLRQSVNKSNNETITYYEGTIKHLSTWNYDSVYGYSASKVKVKLLSDDDTPVSLANVTIKGPGWAQSAYTHSDGTTDYIMTEPNVAATVYEDYTGQTKQITTPPQGQETVVTMGGSAPTGPTDPVDHTPILGLWVYDNPNIHMRLQKRMHSSPLCRTQAGVPCILT